MRLPTALCALPLVLFGLLGCGGIPFDVGQDLVEQRVPGSPIGGILPSFIAVPIPLTIDISAETQKRSTGPARSAQLKSLTLRATPKDMPSGNFDFLEEVHIFIAARDGSLPEKEIARLQPTPKGQTSVQFTIVPDVDLLPYVNKGAQITSSAKGTQPQREFRFDGRIEITVRI